MPLVRHLWWWLGIRSVSKTSIVKLLQSGKSVVLVPGGVREIQSMCQSKEVVYLKKRYGFVKLAIQTGTPLIPVFAFGQSQIYTMTKLSPGRVQELTSSAQGAASKACH